MFQPQCKALGCTSPTYYEHDFCPSCIDKQNESRTPAQSLSEKYPKYYKPVGSLKEVDVYAVHYLFDIQDPSGCIQHASKKLLLSGARTGGKSMFMDIREARDTLTRWLELHAHQPTE
jgi:hypothetical protein